MYNGENTSSNDWQIHMSEHWDLHVMLDEGNCVLAAQNCDMIICVLGTNTQTVHVLRI